MAVSAIFEAARRDNYHIIGIVGSRRHVLFIRGH